MTDRSATKLPEIKSDFALLDVKRGRRTLFKALGFTGRRKDAEPIPVTITGRIIGAWGKDDRTSQEFEIEVVKVEVHPRGGAEQ